MLGNTLLISEKETIRKRTAENYWYYLKKLLNTEKYIIRLSVLDYDSVFQPYRLCIDFQISLKFEDQTEEEKVFPEDQAVTVSWLRQVHSVKTPAVN